MNDIAFKVIIKNDGIDDVIFKTLMLKGEKGDKGDAGGAEIDDTTTSSIKTWSSNKIRNEIDAKPVNLSQLGDVDLDTITDGQMLGYNLTAGKWENKTADASTLKYDANTTIKSKIDDKADSAGLSLVAVSGAYNDLSNKPTIPDELVEMSDVDIDALSLTDGDGLKWNATTGKWENGAVSATSALVDLTDVALDSPIPDFASLVYNATAGKWKNKQLTIACTEAQYNTWKNASPSQLIPCTHYILTDAQNLNPTADDVEFSAGVSVADELNDLNANKANKTISTGGGTAGSNVNLIRLTIKEFNGIKFISGALQVTTAISAGHLLCTFDSNFGREDANTWDIVGSSPSGAGIALYITNKVELRANTNLTANAVVVFNSWYI